MFVPLVALRWHGISFGLALFSDFGASKAAWFLLSHICISAAQHLACILFTRGSLRWTDFAVGHSYIGIWYKLFIVCVSFHEGFYLHEFFVAVSPTRPRLEGVTCGSDARVPCARQYSHT